jgi:sugar-phosphatase
MDCLAIEDSPAGVRAARNAGMTVIAVTNSHAAVELGEADVVVDSLTALRIEPDLDRLWTSLIVARSI